MKKIVSILCSICLVLGFVGMTGVQAEAGGVPALTVTFASNDQSVVVEGIPAESADGSVKYQMNGYLNYPGERIETICYAPNVVPYDIPEKKAYIFNWADVEFLLPCSGEYTFTAYLTANHPDGSQENGPKTTISFYLTKKDTSTNWGPGLPNTTVESYDLGQIKGKDKPIVKEEEKYTWTIKGTDIVTVPEENIALELTLEPAGMDSTGVDEFFGETSKESFNIEHDGEFGFKASLEYKLGAEHAGRYASLFYVAGNGVFEFMESVLIDEAGNAVFSFTHASDYIVTITDEPYTGQDLNPEPEVPVEENPPVEEEIP